MEYGYNKHEQATYIKGNSKSTALKRKLNEKKTNNCEECGSKKHKTSEHAS